MVLAGWFGHIKQSKMLKMVNLVVGETDIPSVPKKIDFHNQQLSKNNHKVL